MYKDIYKEEDELVKHDDVVAGDSTPNTRRKKETEPLTYTKVICDPYYRGCTFVLVLLTFLNQVTGINSINIYSLTIFENIQKDSPDGGGITPRMGSVYLMVA